MIKINNSDVMTEKNNKPNLKVASILDEFSHEGFKYECCLLPLGIENWKSLIQTKRPSVLFVESAWRGNNDSWRYKISSYNNQPKKELISLVSYCRSLEIPTVFWNKEDPVHFDYFINSAMLFDYIFTTDTGSIEKYKSIAQHDRVYLLPFAAQPRIHNPINRNAERLGKIAFAGTWHEMNYEERKADMENVLEPAMKFGLHIYDRMMNFKENNSYKYPTRFQPYIKGYLSYKQMVNTYKSYEIFMNVNIVKNSTSMFSRRIFELLACGTNVISNYSTGIHEMLPDIVKLSKNKSDTEKYIEMLLKSEEMRDRLSLLGQRKVFNEHTYQHRVDTILEKINIAYDCKCHTGVTVISFIDKPEAVSSIIRNYEKQKYENKELIIVLHGKEVNQYNSEQLLNKRSNINIIRINETELHEDSFNFVLQKASFEYIAYFDSACYYGPDFLSDLMNTFKYTDADIVGKSTYYSYFKGEKTLALRNPGMEYRYVNHLSCSSMIAKKQVFDKVRFSIDDLINSEEFFMNCGKNGYKMYSSDRFNFVSKEYIVHGNYDNFLRNSSVVMYTEDYKLHVTV